MAHLLSSCLPLTQPYQFDVSFTNIFLQNLVLNSKWCNTAFFKRRIHKNGKGNVVEWLTHQSLYPFQKMEDTSFCSESPLIYISHPTKKYINAKLNTQKLYTSMRVSLLMFFDPILVRYTFLTYFNIFKRLCGFYFGNGARGPLINKF